MEEMHATVSGRVQGVMYRDFARRAALWLGLTGYVRNRADGRVDVVAQGERAALESLLKRLRRGPLFARIDAVDVAWQTSSELHDTFAIVPSI